MTKPQVDHPNAKPDLSKPWCYFIPVDQHDEHGYIPSIVVGGDPGHYPMLGNGEHATPWYWGKTLEQAQEVAREANARRGITELQEAFIIASSMRANWERA